MKRPALITLAVVAGALASLLLLLREPGDPRGMLPAAERTVDYFVEQVTVTEMSLQGQPLRTLQADTMQHIAETGEVELAQPQFVVFTEGALPAWQLRAREGVSTAQGERVTLTGDVTVWRTGDRPLTITTDYLLVLPTEERAETDAPVTLTSPTAQMDAVGMEISMANETIVVRADVRGIYAR